MKNPLVVLALLLLLTIPSFSQEEGAAVARLRFDKPNTLMVGGGLSLTFGKNVGDYSRGMNWEAGFQHRLNKVMSVGAFISKVRFNYDPSKSLEYLFSTEDQDLQISPSSPDTYRDLYVVPSGYNFLSGYQLSFGGGDLTQTSVGVNLRFDLIPYSEKIPDRKSVV